MRYENLLANPEAELKKILLLLGWDNEEKLLPGIIKLFSRNKSETKNFNKGEISRFEKELSPDELERTESMIGEIITGMDYKLTTGK